MKKLLVFVLLVSVLSCKEKAPEPEPDFAADYAGDYWTETADGNNSSIHSWAVRAKEKMLDIDYTINYIFRYQGKEIRSIEVYKLRDIQVLNPSAFKIDQTAELTDDGKSRARRVQGDATRTTKPDGTEVIAVTFRFTDPGNPTPITTDRLEFKKRK
jgi:hypothetical protein